MIAPDWPLLSIVIPVRDDAVRLRRCLAAVRANRYPGEKLEILVADNGSADASVWVARDADAKVLQVPGVTVAELRNRGAAASDGDILVFVDADHEIAQGWLTAAVENLRLPGVGATGALYTAPGDGTWVQKAYDGLRTRLPGRQDVSWLGSGNLAVRRQTFEKLGGFDSSLETCEDVDFCQRLLQSGQRVLSDERLRSVHLGDPATLRALFFGELWRGRDNLRVSLRGPLTARDLPSVVIPLIDLAAMAVGVAGLGLISLRGVRVACAGAAIVAGFAALRTVRMHRERPPAGLGEIARSFAVACVYDAARALALVARPSHHVRRQKGSAQS